MTPLDATATPEAAPGPGGTVDAACPGVRPPGRPRDEQATTAITEAALRQLEEVGYVRMSMESVASEAGVARATVYRRFRDKADLITAAIERRGVPGGDVRSDRPRAALVAFLEEFDQRFAESCVEVVGTLIGSRDDRAALELHRQRIVRPRVAHARALVVRAQELGELPASLDPDLAVQMLTGSVFARRVAGLESERSWASRAVDMLGGRDGDV
ncbi:MAG TPA: TetR/AcrR family transcriptional regulator [Acidimicrobiales bacterium]|nr:TetR/AcrR family transcriptional regulator [Acidimicrobiales bacterium]